MARLNQFSSTRLRWSLWLAALGFLAALALFPASYRTIRLATLVLAFVVWFGFIGLMRQHRVLRFSLLVVTVITAGFLMSPARGTAQADVLRTDYLFALRRYEGVSYYWGGETARGIDCSGLVRRGLIDALFWRGLRHADAGPVRQAISLWWHDCTANALGDGYRSLTARVLDTPSINVLDHSKLVPGDLAVTANGIHIMAYLGEHLWIEADPGAGSVIIVNAPAVGNVWFQTPMKVVRWSVLQRQGTVGVLNQRNNDSRTMGSGRCPQRVCNTTTTKLNYLEAGGPGDAR